MGLCVFMVIVEKIEFNLRRGKCVGRSHALLGGEGFAEYIQGNCQPCSLVLFLFFLTRASGIWNIVTAIKIMHPRENNRRRTDDCTAKIGNRCSGFLMNTLERCCSHSASRLSAQHRNRECLCVLSRSFLCFHPDIYRKANIFLSFSVCFLPFIFLVNDMT